VTTEKCRHFPKEDQDLRGQERGKRARVVTESFSEITESSGMSGNLNEAGSLTSGDWHANEAMRKSCGARGGGASYTSGIHDLHGGSSAGR
jgi:hypothetical protein